MIIWPASKSLLIRWNKAKAGATMMLASSGPCLSWPVPLLERVLHEPRPASLLKDLDEHNGQQDLRDEDRKEERPLLHERLKRRHTDERARHQQRGHRQPEYRDEVPTQSDSPPEDAAQQISHTHLPFYGGRYQEGRQRQPEDHADRAAQPERQPELESGELEGPGDGVGHDQESQHRATGHQAPERGAGGRWLPGRTVR